VTEIQMLIVGIAIGSQLMNALHTFWSWRDAERAARRSRAESEAALQRATEARRTATARLHEIHRGQP
jgi:hypothetical protein